MQTFLRAGILLLLLLAGPDLRSEEASGPSTETLLQNLRNPDPDVRIEALRALQTSLDPRIPAAMLPLLADEGNSIRRLAARALGSRWWQIPGENQPAYLAALKRNASGEFDDETNMVHRALGLLTRSYEGGMFARSADKRWVVYERYGLPCLIDTRAGTEELLGWSADGYAALPSAWGNGPTAPCILWHARKPLAAFSILYGRKETAFWVWQHGAGLRKFSADDLMKPLGLGESDIHMPGGFFTDLKEWQGDELRLEVFYTTLQDGQYIDHSCVLGWDAAKDTWRVISRSDDRTS